MKNIERKLIELQEDRATVENLEKEVDDARKFLEALETAFEAGVSVTLSLNIQKQGLVDEFLSIKTKIPMTEETRNFLAKTVSRQRSALVNEIYAIDEKYAD